LCRSGPALRAEATAQAPHDAHARLAHALLNGLCLRTSRQIRPTCSSIPPHDNDDSCFSCHHLVRHHASFLSLPHASASAPPHSQQMAWGQAPPARIRSTPAPTPTHVMAIARSRGRFTSCAYHRFRSRRTSHSSSRPSPRSSYLTAALAHGRIREPTDARRCRYGASRLKGN
jgi:hypothetical protein